MVREVQAWRKCESKGKVTVIGGDCETEERGNELGGATRGHCPLQIGSIHVWVTARVYTIHSHVRIYLVAYTSAVNRLPRSFFVVLESNFVLNRITPLNWSQNEAKDTRGDN